VMVFDGLRFGWSALELEKDPGCPGCGSGTLTPRAAAPPAVAAEALRGAQVVDVREPDEWAERSLPDSVLIPLGELPARLGELDRQRRTVVLCKRGPRSQRGAAALTAAGFADVSWLAGGLDALKPCARIGLPGALDAH